MSGRAGWRFRENSMANPVETFALTNPAAPCTAGWSTVLDVTRLICSYRSRPALAPSTYPATSPRTRRNMMDPPMPRGGVAVSEGVPRGRTDQSPVGGNTVRRARVSPGGSAAEHDVDDANRSGRTRTKGG